MLKGHLRQTKKETDMDTTIIIAVAALVGAMFLIKLIKVFDIKAITSFLTTIMWTVTKCVCILMLVSATQFDFKKKPNTLFTSITSFIESGSGIVKGIKGVL